MNTMRRLTLHASALTDDEYTLYTHALKELAEIDVNQPQGTGGAQGVDGDDEYYEGIRLGVREVRAWLRGRYAGKVGVGVMDSILKFFSPSLAASDTMTGGQFFAALRLVTHVVNGKELDRGLAFVQARPSSQPSSSQPQPQPQPPRTSRPASPSQAKKPVPPPPRAQPPQHPGHTSHPPYPPYAPHPSSSSVSSSTSSHPGPGPVHSASNPFLQHQLHQHQALHQQHHTQSQYPAQSKTQAQTSTTTTRPDAHKPPGPPLPPRKTTGQAPPPPPRHRHHHSYSSSSSTGGGMPAMDRGERERERAVPVPPPKPSEARDTYTQSLQASKAAHSAKKAEEVRERERVTMQVLKSSSGYAVGGGGGGSGTQPFRSSNTSGGVPPPPPQHTKPLRSASPSKVPSSSPIHALFSSSASASATTAKQAQGLSRVPPPPPSISSASRSSSASASVSSEDSRSRSHSNPASTSYSNSYSNSYASAGQVYGRYYAPAVPHKRQSSVSMSVSSLEQVALARAPSLSSHPQSQHRSAASQPGSRSGSRPRTGFGSGSSDGGGYTQSPFGSPRRGEVELLSAPPPPRHPDRRGGGGVTFDEVYGETEGGKEGREGEGREDVFKTPWGSPGGGSQPSSPTARVFRSHSFHQPSSPRLGAPSGGGSGAPEVPPRRRKRPESMQIGMLRRVSGGGGTSPFDDDLPTVDTDSQSQLSPPFASPTSHSHAFSPGGHLAVPLPPPRRKVTATTGSVSGGIDGQGGGGAGLVRHASLSSSGSGRGGVHRRSSLSVGHAGTFSTTHEPRSPGGGGSGGGVSGGRERESGREGGGGVSPLNMKSMLGAIERTGLSMNEKITGRFEQLQPKLEKARFKAEAGLNSRRGFIPPPNHNPHHANAHLTSRDDREAREGLMGGREDEGGGDEMGVDEGSGEDGEGGWTPGDEGEREGGRGRSVGRREERDGMKWPVGPGEGWVAL